MAKRILIAGFQHETNTFAPSKAHYANFEHGESHPAMVRGADILPLRSINIPIGGFIVAAEKAGWSLLPVIWTAASPSAHVTKSAFEKITEEIVGAAYNGGFDAIYLDLHGAMVAEHTDDGEGTVLERVRAAVGWTVPVVASLDLHANVTERMLREADALIAFRTYPHIYMAESGERAAKMLQLLLDRKAAGCHPLRQSTRRLPFLIPINAMCTLIRPSCGIYAELAARETGDVVSLSFAPGFPAADFPECGPVIWGYGETDGAVKEAVQALYDKMLIEEASWQVSFLSPDEAVRQAMEISQNAEKPVVIADTQDNPGAGGDSNTMGMLRALLRNGAKGAAIGLIWDPAAAAAAHKAGVGAFIDVALGGISNVPGDKPLQAHYEVVALSEGKCRYDGPMMNGLLQNVGLAACLCIDGVLIVISSVKAQMLDRNLFRLGGVQPEAMKILVIKSSVHFRADFQPIAQAVLVVKAPGPMTADPADLPWTRLAPGIRTSPIGKPFVGKH